MTLKGCSGSCVLLCFSLFSRNSSIFLRFLPEVVLVVGFRDDVPSSVPHREVLITGAKSWRSELWSKMATFHTLGFCGFDKPATVTYAHVPRVWKLRCFLYGAVQLVQRAERSSKNRDLLEAIVSTHVQQAGHIWFWTNNITDIKKLRACEIWMVSICVVHELFLVVKGCFFANRAIIEAFGNNLGSVESLKPLLFHVRNYSTHLWFS